MSNSPSTKLLRLALLKPKHKPGPAQTTAPSTTDQHVTKTTILQNITAKSHHTPVVLKDQTGVNIPKSEPPKVVYIQHGKAGERIKFKQKYIRSEPPIPRIEPVVCPKLDVFIKSNRPPTAAESASPTDANFDKKLCIQDDTKWKFLNWNIKYNTSTETRKVSATFVHVDGHLETRTADRLIELIGTTCFDIVFSTILSNQSDALKKRAVLALLTRQLERKEIGTMTFPLHSELFAQFKGRRKPRNRIRRRPQPYVFQETKNFKIRKTVIDPFENSAKINELIGPDLDEGESIPEQSVTNSSRAEEDNLSNYDKLSHVSLPSTIMITDSILNYPEPDVQKAVERFTDKPSISSAVEEIYPFNNAKITQSQSNKYSNTTPMQDLNTGQKRENKSLLLHDYRQRKKKCTNAEFNSHKINTSLINDGKTVNAPVPDLNVANMITVNVPPFPKSNSMFTETVNKTVMNSNDVNIPKCNSMLTETANKTVLNSSDVNIPKSNSMFTETVNKNVLNSSDVNIPKSNSMFTETVNKNVLNSSDVDIPKSNSMFTETVNKNVLNSSDVNIPKSSMFTETVNKNVLNSSDVNIPKSNSMFTETANKNVLNSNDVNMTRDMRIWDELPSYRRDLIGGVKPEDWFHLATPDRLRHLTQEDRNAWMQLQMYIDWKYCTEADEDNNLPIHIAVLNNDLDLLKRQCYMLKARNQCVDMGDANFNYSALQMCIVHEADVEIARELLRHGASPLEPDDEERTALHLAAEATSWEYLEVMLQHMAASPRGVLEATELWTHEMSDYKAKDLISCLFTLVVKKCDNSGHTPLTLAARMGHYEHVMHLLEQIVDTGDAVNFKSPLTGNTALYETVEACCHHAEKKGDKSRVPDNFAKTIQHLIRYGADPWIENGFGSSILTLISEYRMNSLNLLINDLVCQSKFRQVDVELETLNVETEVPVNKHPQKILYEGSKPFIIIKNGSGGYNYEDPSIKRSARKTLNSQGKANANSGLMENNGNINKKAAESSLQDFNPVQNIQAVKNKSNFPVKTVSPYNVQSDQVIPSVKNRQAVQNINDIPVNIASPQNINVVRTMPSVHNMQSDQNTPSVQNIRSVRNITSVQNMPSVQNIPSVRNVLSGQNMTSVQSIQALNKGANVPNVAKLQQEVRDSSLDSSGKPIILKNLQLTNSVDFMKNINMKSLKIKIMSAVPKRSHPKDSQEDIVGKEPAKKSAIVGNPKRVIDKPQNIIITPRKISSSNQEVEKHKEESLNVAAPVSKLKAAPFTSENFENSSFNDVFLSSVKKYRTDAHDWTNTKNNSHINAVESKCENNSIVTNGIDQGKIKHLENMETEKLDVGNTYDDSENVFRGFKSNEINISAKKRCLELIKNEENVGSGEKKAKL